MKLNKRVDHPQTVWRWKLQDTPDLHWSSLLYLFISHPLAPLVHHTVESEINGKRILFPTFPFEAALEAATQVRNLRPAIPVCISLVYRIYRTVTGLFSASVHPRADLLPQQITQHLQLQTAQADPRKSGSEKNCKLTGKATKALTERLWLLAPAAITPWLLTLSLKS